MFYLLGTPRHQMHATHTFGEVRFPESSLQKGLPHILNTPLKMHHLVRQRSAEAADPKKSFLFVFLCTCACWSMCVLGCACVHVCVCVHIQRSTLVYLSQYTSHLAFFFLYRISHCTSGPAWLSSEPQGSSWLQPPQHWGHAQIFTWLLGTWIQLLMLAPQTFYPLSCFLSWPLGGGNWKKDEKRKEKNSSSGSTSNWSTPDFMHTTTPVHHSPHPV